MLRTTKHTKYYHKIHLYIILLVTLILEHRYRHLDGGKSIGEESGEDAVNKKIFLSVGEVV